MKVILTVLCSCVLSGCNSVSDIKLVKAAGIVTYNGAPLAGATVTFFPQNGPLAIGTTDIKGGFKLSTGSFSGCAVGPVKAAVRVIAPDDDGHKANDVSLNSAKTPAEMQEASKRMAEMTTSFQGKAKSKKALIPERYQNADKSDLKFTVDANASKNDFKIELKD